MASEAEFWVRTPELHLADLALRHLRYLLEFDKEQRLELGDPDGFDYRKLVTRLMRDSVHDVDEISAVSDFIRLDKMPRVCLDQIKARMQNNPRREEYLAQVYGLEALLQVNRDYQRLPSSNAITITSSDNKIMTVYENAGPRNTLPGVAKELFEKTFTLSGDRIVTHQDEDDSEHSVLKEILLRMMRIEAYQGAEANVQLFSKLRAHERARFVLEAFKKGESHLKEVRKRLSPPPSPEAVNMSVSVPKSTDTAAVSETSVERWEPRQSGTHSKDSSTLSIERLPVLDNNGRPIEPISPVAPGKNKSKSSQGSSRSERPPPFSVYRNTGVDPNIGALIFVVKLSEISGILMEQTMRIRIDQDEEDNIELAIESPFEEFQFSHLLPSAARGYKLKVNFDPTASGTKANTMQFKTLVGLFTLYELIEEESADKAYVVLFASEKPLADGDNTTTFIANANRAVASAFNEEFGGGNNLIIYTFKGSFQLVAQPQNVSAKNTSPIVNPKKNKEPNSDVLSVFDNQSDSDDSDSESE